MGGISVILVCVLILCTLTPTRAHTYAGALCSVGVISVIVVYVSLDYHVDDLDIP